MDDLAQSIIKFNFVESFIVKPFFSRDGKSLSLTFKYKINGTIFGGCTIIVIDKETEYPFLANDGHGNYYFTFQEIADFIRTGDPFSKWYRFYNSNLSIYIRKGKLNFLKLSNAFVFSRSKFSVYLKVPAQLCIQALENAHQLVLNFLKPK